MNSSQKLFTLAVSGLLIGCSSTPNTTSTVLSTLTPTVTIANLQPFTDTSGTFATYSDAGAIVESTPFFQSLGTNGRTCGTCHQASQGMSITPAAITALFTSSNGTDALFNAVDGANCPNVAAGSSTGRSLLLNSGLIRIPLTVPAKAQYTVTAVHDPYGCAVSLNSSGQQILSVYRRPLPVSGLPFLSNVMWDTRETAQPLTSAATFSTNLNADLTQQMIDAISTHEQGSAAPTAAQIAAILSFSQGLYTAQATDSVAGSLSANGATGGPSNFASMSYVPGVNDSASPGFNPNVFTLYTAWRNSTNAQQASIARGEDIFNNAPMNITNVSGINDNPAFGSPAVLRGSCATCHDTPNVGNHSLPVPVDTGQAHAAGFETLQDVLAGLGRLNTPDLPIYQINGCKDASNAPVTYYTTDPGKGVSSGMCADINRQKIPPLRGLGARGPFFHNGSATSTTQIVNFYNARFRMGLNAQQMTDLTNFLNAL